MSAPKIKFCGITREHDAEMAVSLGAWAVGMILWPQSPRAVSIDQAAELAALVKRRAESAGVFVNATLDEITRTVEATGLTIVQLHGDEGPSFAIEVGRRTGCKVIKAIRVSGGSDIQAAGQFHTDFRLFDTYKAGVPGGTGETFNWELVESDYRRLDPPKNKGERTPLILSGGLTPENVGRGIEIVKPWGVDVSSGVESAPGYKDHEKMRGFAAAVAATAPPPPIVVEDGASPDAGIYPDADAYAQADADRHDDAPTDADAQPAESAEPVTPVEQ